MDNLLSLALEAHHDGKNHHRRYTITVGRDLFDRWTVSIRYGRVGQRGQELRFSEANPSQLRAVIYDRLRRRLSAPRRIGCAYRIRELSVATGTDAADWFPAPLLGRLLAKQK